MSFLSVKEKWKPEILKETGTEKYMKETGSSKRTTLKRQDEVGLNHAMVASSQEA
jgi:hypothetical protein